MLQVGVSDCSYPVLGGFKWERTYWAEVATPLSVGDVVAGKLMWQVARFAAVSAVFLVVMAAFGVIASPFAALVVPAAVLTGMSTATLTAAFAATQDSDYGMSLLFRLGVLPMNLFAGVFYPISRLPQWLQVVAQMIPLTHGVSIFRALALGTGLGWGLLLDALYLAAWAPVGRALPAHLRPAAGAMTGWPYPRRRRDSIPPLGSRRALLLLERNARLYIRHWVLFLTGVAEPLLFLLSIGIGLGGLVGPIQVGDTVPYATFVAPALLATSAMNGAMIDAIFNLFFKLSITHIYDAVLATPLDTDDVALGEV